MKKTIALSGGEFELRLLCAADALDCLAAAEECLARIVPPDCYEGLGEALAEYGALACFCLCREGRRVFACAREALSALSLDDLAAVYDGYSRLEQEARL